MSGTRRQLGTLLVESGMATQAEVEEALGRQKETGELLGRILVASGVVTEEDILGALGAQSGMQFVKLDDLEILPDVTNRVSGPIVRIYKIMPISFDGTTMTIALSDPLNIRILDDLRFMLNCEIQGAIAIEDEIMRAVEKYYGAEMETVGDLLDQIEHEMAGTAVQEISEDEEAVDISTIKQLANEAPVVKLLNLVLIQAIRDRGSDIHFEPFEDTFKIRYRVDGVLYEMIPPPKHLALALTSRIKVMANLDIAERRLPQDGRIQLNMAGREVDLRISTLPTMFGESVVMRVLDRSVVMLDIEQLGFSKGDMSILQLLMEKPNGILLTTGPTGCGKTTTLYAALKKINSPDVKIITTEDPVEYNIPGIVQVQIKDAIGLTFGLCLRSILRQDPDVILVGEIRDLDTAEMAIQASLTGHLVLSTLHTNDAAGTITRLVDMDIEPFLLTSTIEAIVGQRLVRTICQNCREAYEPSDEELLKLGVTRGEVEDKTFYRGTGCEACRNVGYVGRAGIFEILVMNEPLRSLIVSGAAAKDLRAKAREHGMRTMRQDGLEKVYRGVTTIEEVTRESADTN